MQKVDSRWHQKQIKDYANELPIYEDYRKALFDILRHACKSLAPLAIVEARAKTLPSFAEKAVRKWPAIEDPIHQFTDLCGARVITQTQYEVEKICRFIRENFKIDEINSNDKARELGPNQFGYLSVHYIVQFPADTPKLLGVPVPQGTGDRKAEIQVRTLLQHAWASISHDSMYKNQFEVPDTWKREMNRLSAMLEQTDNGFLHVVDGLAAYAVNYGAYMSAEEMEYELEVLQLLFNNVQPEEQLGVALRIASIHKAAGDWSGVISRLTSFEKSENPAVKRALGYAFCQQSKANPASVNYLKGHLLLEKALELDTTDAEAYACLGWSYDIMANRENAYSHYAAAYELKPANPYYLGSFLEHEISDKKSLHALSLLKPTLRSALATCRSHVDVRIEIPWALFTMGKLHLLLGEPYESLSTYVQGMQLCISGHCKLSEEVLDQQLKSLERLKPDKEEMEGHEWVRRLLILAKKLRSPSESIEHLKSEEFPPYGESPSKISQSGFEAKTGIPVVILAGSCGDLERVRLDKYRKWLEEAFKNFEGYVISGGSTSGICGLLGKISGALAAREEKNFCSVGYMPAAHSVAKGTTIDRRYDSIIHTQGSGFSALEPLQMWIDMLAAGVQPGNVRLLGIGGGKIADFEYRLAIALGATVGALEGSGGSASEIIKDKDARETGRLVILPADEMTLKAFVLSDPPASVEEMNIAKAIHENASKDKRYRIDPAYAPWDELSEPFVTSNIQQARYSKIILRSAGFDVRKKEKDKIHIIQFTDDDKEQMAEMEHGRWNVERISRGWKLGSRDPEKKTSPYLVPWSQLTEKVRDYDRNAVTAWPGIFKKEGIEIYRK